jgi:quinol monooxygenase YgiN
LSDGRLRNIVRLRYKPGAAEAAREVLGRCVAHAREHEPGLVTYEFFDHGERCTGFEVFASSSALAEHMEGPIVTELMPELLAHCDIEGIETYGVPDGPAKAILDAFGIELTDHCVAGYAR